MFASISRGQLQRLDQIVAVPDGSELPRNRRLDLGIPATARQARSDLVAWPSLLSLTDRILRPLHRYLPAAYFRLFVDLNPHSLDKPEP